MDHHTKSVLAFSDRSAKIPIIDLPAARESILVTPLRKISDFLGGIPSESSDFTKENSAGETHRDGAYGESVQGEATAVFGPIYSTHFGYLQQSRPDWNSKTCGESILEDHSGEERSETSMDFEGDRGEGIPNLF